MSKQLVAIDSRVPDYQVLIDQLGPRYNHLLLNSDSDGLGELSEYLAKNSGFDAIHLISHGSSGRVVLGTSVLSTWQSDARRWLPIPATAFARTTRPAGGEDQSSDPGGCGRNRPCRSSNPSPQNSQKTMRSGGETGRNYSSR